MKLSKRIVQMQASPIRKLVPYAETAKKNGKKVYQLNIGQPDIQTPKVFLDAIKAFDEPVISYAMSQGEPALIEAIQGYYRKHNIEFDIDDILITNGGSEALLFALIAIADCDDEILVPEPFYTNYNGFSLPVGVNIKPITTSPYKGFRLPEKSEIQALISDKTKGILLSNPGNPTGVVYNKSEMMMLADLALENDLFIISDEVYREFIYGDTFYMSFGNIKSIEDRVVIIDSISKRYSACGARIGSISSKNTELIQNILKLCMSRLCVPTLEQIGATELYKVDNSYFESVNKEYRARRDLVYRALNKMPGVVCMLPNGAFYVIAKLPIDNSENFAIWLLESFDIDGETLMFAPAEGFYATEGLGKDEVRLAYILNQHDLEKAMNILKKALEIYPGRRHQ